MANSKSDNRAGGGVPARVSRRDVRRGPSAVSIRGPGSVLPEVLPALIHPSRQEVFFFGTPAGDLAFSEETMPDRVDVAAPSRYGIPGNLARFAKSSSRLAAQVFA